MSVESDMSEHATAITSIGGAAAGVLAFIKYGYPPFRKAINNYFLSRNAASSLGDAFGREAGPKIMKMLSDLRYSHDIEKLKSRMKERTSHVGIYLCDPSGACIESSDYLCSMFVMSEHEMIGFGWLSAIRQSDIFRVNEAWKYAVANRLPYHCEYGLINEGRQVVTDAVALKADDGKTILLYVGCVRYVEASP